MIHCCLRFTISLLLFALAACSSINSKAVKDVHSVAFVGFDVDLSADTISPLKTPDQLARSLQDTVKKGFEEELNWHITENGKLANNAVYQGFYHQYKSRLLKGGLVEDSQLREMEASRLSFSEREQLIKSLNVDAIALMTISSPSQREVSKNGVTSRYYQASINFVLYEKGNENSIWKANGVQGSSPIALTFATTKNSTATFTEPKDKEETQSLSLAQMLNGGGIKNSIDRFLSVDNTPELQVKKYHIMQDAIKVSTQNLIFEYQNN